MPTQRRVLYGIDAPRRERNPTANGQPQMRDDRLLQGQAALSLGEDLTPAVGLSELCKWFAPWVSASLLVAAALLGLFTAATGNFAAGFLTFGLSIVALGRGLKNYFDGVGDALWSPVLVTNRDSLLFLVALLVVLAVLGLMLASRAQGSVWQDIGYALFGIALGMIAGNLKHYFDRCESQSPGDPRSTA